jgi:hypothetical protein
MSISLTRFFGALGKEGRGRGGQDIHFSLYLTCALGVTSDF